MNHKVQTILTHIFLSAFVVTSLSGCFKNPMAKDMPAAKQVSDKDPVQKNDVTAASIPQVPVTELKNMRFPSVTMFLWKENLTVESISDALRTIKDIDKLETQNILFTQLLTAFGENPTPELQKQIDAYLAADCSELQALTTPEENEAFDRSECIGRYFEKASEQGLKLIEKFASYTEGFENGNSPVVTFDVKENAEKPESKTVAVAFYDINLPGEKAPKSKRSNLTDDGKPASILNVNFAEEGGILTFDIDQEVALALEKHTYRCSFKLKRTGLNDLAGRTIYSGDIVVKKMPEGKILRRGQIKLSDRAN